MIFNISQCLVIISEILFHIEKDYKFMLNSNFEIISISKNFEKNYLLNQKIFHIYDLKLMDILNIKIEKLNKKFTKDFNFIARENSIRAGKTEEYFIPQLYIPKGENNFAFISSKNFNIKKSQILTKLSNSQNNNDKLKNDNNNEDFEDEKLINNEISIKDIILSFQKPGKLIIHKKLKFAINKMKFIENISEQLLKISDIKLYENNEKNSKEHNLIINSKNLIYELLTKNELSKETLIIEFKLSFYYDKPFYFITIKEENKFSIQKSDNKMYKILIPNALKSNNIKKIHSNINNDKKSRNPHIIFIENNKRSDLHNSLNFNNAKKQIEKKIIITEKNRKI